MSGMRVERQIEFLWYSDGSGPSRHTDANVTEFCCPRMEEAWRDSAVGFGEFDSSYVEQEGVNIYRCHPYSEGAVWDEYRIDFCPFCGLRIEVVTVESVRRCRRCMGWPKNRKRCICRNKTKIYPVDWELERRLGRPVPASVEQQQGH